MSETRRRLLDAAREELLGPEYDVLAGLVLVRVARRAGVPLRTAKRELKADELRAALRDDVLRVRPGELGIEQFAQLAEIIADPTRPFEALIADILDLTTQHHAENDRFRAMLAFWALSPENDEVRARVNDIYEHWLQGGANGIRTLLAYHSDQISIRESWITLDDFLRAAIALTDGLAIQQSLEHHTDDGEVQSTATDLRPMDPELARKVLLSVFARMVGFDDVGSVDEVLKKVEDRHTGKR